MLLQRVLVAAILLPLGLVLIYLGGFWLTALVIIFTAIASWEYANLFRKGNYHPSMVLLIAGGISFPLARHLYGFGSDSWLITFFVLSTMTVFLLEYEKGNDKAATDFAITVGGIVYIGWLGSYLISLRQLNEGLWWFLTALPAVWIADSGAYFIGKRFGKHKLSPRLSPKKTWEGYLAGVVTGTLGAALLVYWWQGYGATITIWQGGLVGFVLSVITPLGDLGESMFKRQFGIKDSSHIIPGHGGAMDRIDSWIWAAAIGYYIVTVFFM